MRSLTFFLGERFSYYNITLINIKSIPLLELLISKLDIYNNCVIKRNSSTMMTSSSENTKNTENIFNGDPDRYNGVTVVSKNEALCTVNEFPKKLQDSLTFWKLNNKRTIWFKVFLEQSAWVPILAQNGFKYHHAKGDFALMYLWLPEESSNIPPFAHTMIGVGAVVVNDKNQVLVVREKHLNYSHWKLPGGYVEPGENLVEAVIREVKEETDVSTEFNSVLTLRHTHNGLFGCSDIYTVVSLKPLTEEIKKCDREIEASIWMDVNEYLSHPKIHGLNKMCVEKYLEYAKENLKVDCDYGVHPLLKKPYAVYAVKKSEGKSEEKQEGNS